MFRKKVNFVISTLILSDLFLFFALGLLTPLFGVFVLENIEGSTFEVIGTATAMYWIARVASVLPISKTMDKIKGEKDEYYAVVTGTFLMAILPLGYIFATLPVHIYIIEFLKGIAGALTVPAWRILFTKFIDKNTVGFGWSFEDFCVGIATAVSAYVGAFIASNFGFKILFICVSSIGLIAAYFLTKLYREERIRNNKQRILDMIKHFTPFKIDSIK